MVTFNTMAHFETGIDSVVQGTLFTISGDWYETINSNLSEAARSNHCAQSTESFELAVSMHKNNRLRRSIYFRQIVVISHLNLKTTFKVIELYFDIFLN